MTMEDTIDLNIDEILKWKVSGTQKTTPTKMLSLAGLVDDSTAAGSTITLEPVWEESSGNIYNHTQLQGARYDQPVTLGADLDLSSKEWTTVSEMTGTFNGNGHTIYGLKTTGDNTAFCKTVKNGGTIKNVTFDGADTALAVVAEEIDGWGTLSGVRVVNSKLTRTLEFKYSQGFLLGKAILRTQEMRIENCEVSNCQTTVALNQAGGLIGCHLKGNSWSDCTGKLTIQGCRVSDVVLMASVNKGAYIGYNDMTYVSISGHYSASNNTNSTTYQDIGQQSGNT